MTPPVAHPRPRRLWPRPDVNVELLEGAMMLGLLGDYARTPREPDVVARPVVTVEHGRVSTYTNWACRCDACREAKSVYARTKRKRAA